MLLDISNDHSMKQSVWNVFHAKTLQLQQLSQTDPAVHKANLNLQ